MEEYRNDKSIKTIRIKTRLLEIKKQIEKTMKLLRQTIRKLILETKDTFPMLADLLMNEDPELIKQAWVLGNSMGVIENYEKHYVHNHGIRKETVAVHTITIPNNDLLYEVRILANRKPFDWHHRRQFEFKRGENNKGIITIITRD